MDNLQQLTTVFVENLVVRIMVTYGIDWVLKTCEKPMGYPNSASEKGEVSGWERDRL